MKKQNQFRCIAIAIMFFISSNLEANSWRVNNFAQNPYGVNMGGTASHPVFGQLSDAVLSPLVFDGDTIYLEASPDSYDGATVNKSLIVIGPGYFLNENHDNSVNNYSSDIEYINFSTGSENSQLIAICVSGYYCIEIEVSDITIKRCKINYSIQLGYSISDIYITGNFFSDEESSSSIIDANYYGFPLNVRLNNNICQRRLDLEYDDPDYQFEQCNNNVFDCVVAGDYSVSCYAASFKNNIVKNAATTVYVNGVDDFESFPDPKVAYNISVNSSIQFGSEYGNIEVSDMTDLFVNQATNTTDGDYQLLTASPGSGNGSDGTDRGVYGGVESNHYTISGLPPMPVIYQIFTNGVVTDDGMLPVTIKAKTVK